MAYAVQQCQFERGQLVCRATLPIALPETAIQSGYDYPEILVGKDRSASALEPAHRQVTITFQRQRRL
jgi:hypothetical protein